jgi:Flagellar P-ring protein
MMKSRSRREAASWLALCVLLAGCEGGNWDWLKKPETQADAPASRPSTRKIDPILANTIGEKALLSDGTPLRLRGFGVVVGLGDTGGSDCPTAVREYLIDYFAKQNAPTGAGPSKKISPQKLLDSPDTAVVGVYAAVPPGARKGTPLDVQIEALGSRTRSLEGGVLLPCELKIFDLAASGQGIIAGRALAIARGPVFTNPFAAADASATSTAGRRVGPRTGFVLGGARTIEERPLQLLLEEPSYAMAKRIERRINEQFGQSPATASAVSQGKLQVNVPANFAGSPGHFIERMTHLLLDGTPAIVEQRLRELSSQLDGDADKLNHASLIWEGVGRDSVPQIQPLYGHANSNVAYFAARAGIRLKDSSAMPVLLSTAKAGGPLALDAIRELGHCGLPSAGTALVPLLNHADERIRVAAYEALLPYRHTAIRSRTFRHPYDTTQPNLIVDLVETADRPMLYARTTREPRVAVFGPRTPVARPTFYNHPLDWVTVSARDEKSELAVFCRTRQSNKLSDKIVIPPRLDELIRAMAAPPIKNERGEFAGLGLPYALVLQTLDVLCRSGSIGARLVMEPTPLADLLGQDLIEDRPESDETTTAPAESADKPAEDPARPE